MASPLNFFSDIGDQSFWSNDELKAALKLAEQAYLRDAREVDYYGQKVQYNSKAEIAQTVQAIRKELARRITGKSGRTKRVTITTTSKGF